MSFDRAKSALNGTRFADLRSVAETGSTNADVRSLLTGAPADGAYPAGDPAGPIVLLADHQSAGRGRRGRAWEAPPGSSVLMTIGYPLAAVPQIRWTLMTMCLSVAVTDASIELGIPSVSIKWPNDLVAEAADVPLGYRKLGGILAETAMSPVLGDCVILGLGLNVNWPGVPAELAATATSLNSLSGQPVDREDLVIAILRRLDEVWLPAVEGSETAVQQLFDVYRQRCSTLRRKVSIELPTGTLTGTATDIAPDGALLVSGPNGIRTVTVGDVVHLRPQQ